MTGRVTLMLPPNSHEVFFTYSITQLMKGLRYEQRNVVDLATRWLKDRWVDRWEASRSQHYSGVAWLRAGEGGIEADASVH
jgi:hypothetical protein